MSIYTNPVYNNPTTIPYKKLKDEPTIVSLFSGDNHARLQRLQRARHRIASAVSCLLCTLAITLALLTVTLLAYSLYGRCFRVDSLENGEDFERFMRMLGGSATEPRGLAIDRADVHREAPHVRRPPYQQGIFPLPRGPGPVIPSEDLKRSRHAQCPLMSLVECKRETFDGYSFKEHQQKVDLSLAKAMLSGHLNTSNAVNNARNAFRQCVKDHDGEKQATLHEFAKKVAKIREFRPENEDEDTSTLLARIAAYARAQFGVHALFRLDVEANYERPDDPDRPFSMYLTQQLPDLNVGQLMLMRRAFVGGEALEESDYQRMYLNVPRLREMVDTGDSAEWKRFTSAEARARWPFFDFSAYLARLNEEKKFTDNVREFTFVVKTPSYFDKLNALLIPATRNDTHDKVELFKMLTIYSVFSGYGQYFGADKIEQEIRQKYQLGNSSPAHPYNFIYTYSDGQASYEALRFCASDLRRHLPHVASALNAEILDDPSRLHETIQRVEGLVEQTRAELIAWVEESSLDPKIRELLAEKLRKMAVSFTTRESLERDTFEEVHRLPSLSEPKPYVEHVAIMKSFLFDRKLARLNSRVEALRSASFAETSAATAEVRYSRLGNWLNVPAAVLTSPILGPTSASSKTRIYSQLVWTLAREMAKAIDSEGLMYNALGVHKPNQADLIQVESIWTDAQNCLGSKVHEAELDGGFSKGFLVRSTLDETLGFRIAYRMFVKELDRVFGTEKKDPQQRYDEQAAGIPDLRITSIAHFFQTASAVYCSANERGASTALLDKFVDSFVKRENILGCSARYDNFDCSVELAQQRQ